jgi:hypothetical protein
MIGFLEPYLILWGIPNIHYQIIIPIRIKPELITIPSGRKILRLMVERFLTPNAFLPSQALGPVSAYFSAKSGLRRDLMEKYKPTIPAPINNNE